MGATAAADEALAATGEDAEAGATSNGGDTAGEYGTVKKPKYEPEVGGYKPLAKQGRLET